MKDPRYKLVKKLIEVGEIRMLDDIFIVIPRSVIIRDTGINYERFTNKLNDPGKFLIKELLKLADLMEVDLKLMLNLAYESYKLKKMKKKK